MISVQSSFSQEEPHPDLRPTDTLEASWAVGVCSILSGSLIRDQHPCRAGAGREKLNCLASTARPRVTPLEWSSLLSVHLEWQLWDLGHPRKYRLSVFTNPVPPCQAQRKIACHNCRSRESNQDACDSISFKSLWLQLRPAGQLPQKYLKDFCEDS